MGRVYSLIIMMAVQCRVGIVSRTKSLIIVVVGSIPVAILIRPKMPHAVSISIVTPTTTVIHVSRLSKLVA